ncbi:hypothetical protein RHSIM_Rhsim13G0092600 [Rhododendron simsii]|uniref:Cupin type-1 domain-containing protein n=1 Tax=Rhododendron simsii TaxID=118357 RepID=A0A834G6L2_RHOSS|nr:hypothetical protein RHSIM_Rhsim13G0092600 [Rhododendron simsii]
MARRKGVVLLVLLMMCYAVAMVGGSDGGRARREREEEGDERGRREREEEEEEEEEGYDEGGGGGGRRREREEMFLMHEMKTVVRTDAGDMKVIKGFDSGGIGGVVSEKQIHLGFITMEPKSLFIPQYLDSNLIIFVRRGEAKVGSIYKEDFVEKQLKGGDVYRIGAGSTFYLRNTAEGQRLHIICSIDKADGFGWGSFQSFFIGGGTNPMSVLSGFDTMTLATAFNVSTSEVRDISTRQRSGPIVFLSEDLHPPNIWAQFVRLKQHEKLQHLKQMVDLQEAATKEEEEEPTWSLTKLFKSVFGEEPNGEDNQRKAPDSYNLYDRKPDFRNNYGWSTAIDKSDYWPLGHSDVGLYLVNLTAGSMMAPHINPRATEYGIVLRGSGTVQVVFPNGTSAMKAKVREGDVFWVPRYYPFCQIASRTGPLEFFGFSTSAHKNQPQFLVGRSSILQSMKGPEFAAAFGVSEEKLRRFVDAQQESLILPSASAAPPEDGEVKSERRRRRIERVVGRFGKGMIMDFD